MMGKFYVTIFITLIITCKYLHLVIFKEITSLRRNEFKESQVPYNVFLNW